MLTAVDAPVEHPWENTSFASMTLNGSLVMRALLLLPHTYDCVVHNRMAKDSL
jgi:hypothetical protein